MVCVLCEEVEGLQAWALSEISVPSWLAEGVVEEPELAGAVAAVRAQWGAWERDIPISVLRCEDGGGGLGISRGERGW